MEYFKGMDLPTKLLKETPVQDPIKIDYLRNLFMGAEEEEEMEFGTNEEKVNPKKSIPKLFCQVGDITNEWHSKTTQKNDAC